MVMCQLYSIPQTKQVNKESENDRLLVCLVWLLALTFAP
jgi:hypothetical protein